MGLGFQGTRPPGTRVWSFEVGTTNDPQRQLAASIIEPLAPQVARGLRFMNLQCVEILSEQEARSLVKLLLETKVPVGFDFETEGFSPRNKVYSIFTRKMKSTRGIPPNHPKNFARPVMFQVWWGGDAYCVPAKFLPLFQDWLESPAPKDIANATFELIVCANVGIKLRGVHRDVIVMDFLLEETSRQGKHALKVQAEDHLGVATEDFSEVFLDRGFESVYLEDPASALRYAAKDPYFTCILGWLHEAKMRSHPDKLWPVYREWEQPFQTVINRMQLQKVPISEPWIQTRVKQLQEELDALTTQAYEILGEPINLGSDKQLADYFYQQKNYPVRATTKGQKCLICHKLTNKKTKGACREHGLGAVVNRAAVNDDVIQYFAQKEDPIAQLVGPYRNTRKIAGTWLDGYARLAHGSAEISPVINSTYVVTGRVSAGTWLTTPEHERHLAQFSDEDTNVFLAADYDQLEVRVLAHVSQDPELTKAIKEGRDPHCLTGAALVIIEEHGVSRIIDVELRAALYEEAHAAVKAKKAKEPITPRQQTLLDARTKGKTVLFGRLYGMGPDKFARDFGISLIEAQQIFNNIFTLYEGIQTFYNRLTQTVETTGYLKTILGRRRTIPELQSDDPGTRKTGERRVFNSPCQCGAADIIRGAMIQIEVDIEAGKPLDRPTFGCFAGEEWRPLQGQLPDSWLNGSFPPALAKDLGLLGRLGFEQVLQIHDEVLLRGPAKNAEAAGARLKAIMVDPFGPALRLAVPLDVTYAIAKSWGNV